MRVTADPVRLERVRDRRRETRKVRQVVVRSAEPVDRMTILERDGWRCQLCGKAIRRRAVYPHPLSATLDHIVPLALGGTHAPENLQAAHARCNSAKQTQAQGEQLRLIG